MNVLCGARVITTVIGVRPGVIAAAIVAIGSSAHAGGGPPTDAYEGIDDAPVDVHALADLYTAINFDGPASGQSQFRAFDPTANEPAVSWLRVRVAHKPRTFGFRVDLGVGDTANAYFADDPASTAHPVLSRWLSHVGQAFVTAIVPGGVAIDAGKFDTPIGLEDNENLMNWNFSRSYVFTYAEPSLHTGLRATYVIQPELTVAAFWLNGWNANIVDGSDMRSYALAARWKPIEEIEAVVVYAGGLERAPTDPNVLAFRNLADAYVTYQATKMLAVAATADYTTKFAGAAGLARFAPVPWLAGAVRAERFYDRSGFATGTPQILEEITATAEARRVERGITFVGRLEYRHDQSTTDVFEYSTVLERTQNTLTFALLASY